MRPDRRPGDRQRHVGSEQRELGLRAVFGQDEGPDADLDRDAQVGQLEGALQSLPDAHRRAGGFLAGGDRRVQDPERVAAHPRHQGAFAGQLAQANADRVQNRVGRPVSEGVVDLGEPLQVDQQEAGGLGVGNAEELVEPVDEVSAVRQTRHVVGVRESLQPLCLVLQLAHDADHPDQDERAPQGADAIDDRPGVCTGTPAISSPTMMVGPTATAAASATMRVVDNLSTRSGAGVDSARIDGCRAAAPHST